MPSSRYSFTRWFRREISEPLEAMYSRMDERLLEEQREPARPPSASGKQSPETE